MIDWLTKQFSEEVSEYSMYYAAQGGVPVSLDVYQSLPADMTTAPLTSARAYDQAVFFLSLGARRADAENNENARLYLLAGANTLEEQREINPRGVLAVLAEAIQLIKDSSLLATDKTQILTILQSSRRTALVIRWLPLVGAVGVGTVFYRYFRSTRSS